MTDDLVSRYDALKAVDIWESDWPCTYSAILALPAVQTAFVRLVFNNADATPKTEVLDVSRDCVARIMEWYGAFCAGDRYTVTMDGRNVRMDQNGAMADG